MAPENYVPFKEPALQLTDIDVLTALAFRRAGEQAPVEAALAGPTEASASAAPCSPAQHASEIIDGVEYNILPNSNSKSLAAAGGGCVGDGGATGSEAEDVATLTSALEQLLDVHTPKEVEYHRSPSKGADCVGDGAGTADGAGDGRAPTIARAVEELLDIGTPPANYY